MSVLTAADLYQRGADTLLASWRHYAQEATAAALMRSPGVAIAVFPHEPERSVYNNALFERHLTPTERDDAIEAMEAAYHQAGITSFAAWVHESDAALCADLERRGYTTAESTRAMGMTLDEIRVDPSPVELAQADWSEHLRVAELPAQLLGAGDHTALHILVARLAGENLATAIAFDLGSDCGIYNVGTRKHARRRGLGTAVTVAHLHDALDRGCHTASLQSTPMAEQLYASIGFRDLGRILEYVPSVGGAQLSSSSAAMMSAGSIRVR
jgi:ribosomal protein S18 acetylase RimI-like enzyme